MPNKSGEEWFESFYDEIFALWTAYQIEVSRITEELDSQKIGWADAAEQEQRLSTRCWKNTMRVLESLDEPDE